MTEIELLSGKSKSLKSFWGIDMKAKSLITRTSLSALILVLCNFFLVSQSFAQANSDADPHALSDAVLAGDTAKVKSLIESGVDLEVLDNRRNPNGRYALNWAAWQNDVEIIAALLDAGADIDLPNVTGFTPLHHAIENRSTEAIALLIERGADLTTVNRNGNTPEQFAVLTGQSNIVKLIQDAAK